MKPYYTIILLMLALVSCKDDTALVGDDGTGTDVADKSNVEISSLAIPVAASASLSGVDWTQHQDLYLVGFVGEPIDTTSGLWPTPATYMDSVEIGIFSYSGLSSGGDTAYYTASTPFAIDSDISGNSQIFMYTGHNSDYFAGAYAPNAFFYIKNNFPFDWPAVWDGQGTNINSESLDILVGTRVVDYSDITSSLNPNYTDPTITFDAKRSSNKMIVTLYADESTVIMSDLTDVTVTIEDVTTQNFNLFKPSESSIFSGSVPLYHDLQFRDVTSSTAVDTLTFEVFLPPFPQESEYIKIETSNSDHPAFYMRMKDVLASTATPTVLNPDTLNGQLYLIEGELTKDGVVLTGNNSYIEGWDNDSFVVTPPIEI